jgi:uncharacterized membrane protein YGL010W
MKSIQENLGHYAAYHRDSRNILTHFVGIPMIVLGVVILLSRPAYSLGGLPFSPAVWAALISVIYYTLLDIRMGVAMGLAYAAMLWVGAYVAPLSTSVWLACGIGLFAVGWVIQFVGHYFEGRKPAFMDDIMGLAIGPLFVAAELAFLMGLRKDLEAAVEAAAGSVRYQGQ